MDIESFLTSRRIPFERIHHKRTYTSNRMAQAMHVPGQNVAKSVLVRTGHGYALAVLPATCQVDLERLQQELGETSVQLAAENELQEVFKDCEPGVRPPFGSLYNLPTIVDDSLSEDTEIVFEAQNHEEALKMSYRDYEAVEHPRHGHFARR